MLHCCRTHPSWIVWLWTCPCRFVIDAFHRAPFNIEPFLSLFTRLPLLHVSSYLRNPCLALSLLFPSQLFFFFRFFPAKINLRFQGSQFVLAASLPFILFIMCTRKHCVNYLPFVITFLPFGELSCVVFFCYDPEVVHSFPCCVSQTTTSRHG